MDRIYSRKRRIFKAREEHNFPMSAIITTTERDFLRLHTPEAVLGMIKDGSYDSKLAAFLNISDPPSEDDHTVIQELFRKELTQSDVGQRKGLVIPKKDAEEFFPKVKKAEKAKGLLLRFLDRKTNKWLDFRYSFYRSSQSYVLSTGWSRYVKANFLKEKDVIKFYECVKNVGEFEERYIMVDVLRWGEGERELKGVKRKEIEIEPIMEMDQKEKGVWLFGVLIG